MDLQSGRGLSRGKARNSRARGERNYDAVCFHCEQAVEKYMKAYLLKKGVDFPKTHNLIELHELCLPLDGSFEIQRDLLLELNQYGVRYRYPGVTAEKEDAKLAMAHAETVRAFLRAKLGLK
ncbi:MAG: HEPN domain-containing protein [Anaerolineae bacterium]|jgi:HEPN domain-containing protein|nr:HEPN domain-containing protein [Anaerolineales bacterium]MCC7511131.1 HEPN domain-containing protein [Anaerolineae bacterium]MCZ2289576.1 HEPN domain-containing protein [Anaerolineales bacterium]